MQVVVVSPIGKPLCDFEALKESIQQVLPAEVIELSALDDPKLAGATVETSDLIIYNCVDDLPRPLGAMLKVIKNLPCIVVAGDPSVLQGAARSDGGPVAFVDRTKIIENIQSTIRTFLQTGALHTPKTPDAHFIALSPGNLSRSLPLKADVYVKLGRDKYVKLLNQGDVFDHVDAETYGVSKQVDSFYLYKDQSPQILKKQTEHLETASKAAESDIDQALKAASGAMEVVHDVVNTLGFTADAQEVAKKSAELVIKAIGTNPNLLDVFRRLKQQEGKYIASHSIMLAEIACAIAREIHWDSSNTFVKMVLAALLHDLSMKDNRLARIPNLLKDSTVSLSPFEINEIKLHPIRGAEYARALKGVPPDIDRIILQHHEQPDATGFPRGLHHNQIDPLSACFIIAHDLLDKFLDQPAHVRLTGFVEGAKDRYQSGNFRKIVTGLSAERR